MYSLHANWHRALALLASLAGAAAARAQAPVVIEHVTVVDVERGRLLGDRRVSITGTRIVSVDSGVAARAPAGAVVVDGRGKFLLPGLWDMHVHALPRERRPRALQTFFPLFVANGVTGVRDMGDILDTLRAVRARGLRDAPAAPRLVAAGPIVDGPRPVFPDQSVALAAPADAPRVVDTLAAAGVDFIKVYSLLPRESYLALAAAARRRGIPFAGHVPVEVTVSEASDAGQRSVEHMAELVLDCSAEADAIRAEFAAAMRAPGNSPIPVALTRARRAARERALRTPDWPRCRAIAERMARNGTWMVPTLAVGANAADTTRPHDPRLRYFEPATVAAWRADPRPSIAPGPGDSARVRGPASAADAAPYLRMLAAAGVGILAGTDLANFYTFPGFDLHLELELLVQAGLTPLDALRAATIGPARFLGATDSLGTVAPGKLADLLLLDADPLADVRNTRRIRAVVANGRLLDRAALDALLAGVERTALDSK